MAVQWATLKNNVHFNNAQSYFRLIIFKTQLLPHRRLFDTVISSRLWGQSAWVHATLGPQFHHLQRLKELIHVKDLEKYLTHSKWSTNGSCVCCYSFILSELIPILDVDTLSSLGLLTLYPSGFTPKSLDSPLTSCFSFLLSLTPWCCCWCFCSLGLKPSSPCPLFLTSRPKRAH